MHLLFVEDHATFAQTVIAEFMAEHSIVVAPSVAVALERVSVERFDALLVDFDLPDGKGDEFVRRVRADGSRTSRTPILAVSGHDVGNAALLDAGANLVCAKSAFAKIGPVLSRLTPLPEPGRLRTPLPRALVSVVGAYLPTLTSFHREELEQMLDELLFGKRASWLVFANGLITHTELRNLLLAHIETSIERLTQSRPDIVAFSLAITTEFERCLFVPVDREVDVAG